MTLCKASALLICAVAALLVQSCVEYAPTTGYPPTPQPPPYPTQYAEAPASPPAAALAPPAAPPTGDDALLAPIALYPDPLIALILPASTQPGQISAAAAFMIQYGDVTQIESQPWDPSVRALAHYPTVLNWMADNMAWTEALGSAFSSSPSDVMEAIQRMRARALAAGTLASTPQQQVFSDDGQIEIYPAQPDFLYVPAYDDSAVYADGPDNGYGGPLINFGEPYPSGIWLNYYFDWGRHRVWAGDHDVWRQHGGWLPPRTGGNSPPPGGHAWHPPASAPRNPQPSDPGHGIEPPRPRPMPGAPKSPPHPRTTVAPALPAQPRTSASPAERPRLNPPPPSPGPAALRTENEGRSPPTQGSPPRGVPAAPGSERGPSVPPPAPTREYSAPPKGGTPPSAPHSAPSATHSSSSTPENGKQDPQK